MSVCCRKFAQWSLNTLTTRVRSTVFVSIHVIAMEECQCSPNCEPTFFTQIPLDRDGTAIVHANQVTAAIDLAYQ